MAGRVSASFIEPMLLLRTDSVPDDIARWTYELKFDGYRAIAFKTGGKVHFRSRHDNDFSVRFTPVMHGLTNLPTVIDGELVAVGEDGRPSFSALQNYGSSNTSIVCYVLDVMVLAGRDVTDQSVDVRFAFRSLRRPMRSQ